jgi:hypothetical protein
MNIHFIQEDNNITLFCKHFGDVMAKAKNMYLDSSSDEPVQFWFNGWKYSVSSKD